MIRGVGVDLVETARMRAAYRRHGERLVRRICTERERDRIQRGTRPDVELARVFALKEAVMKALGTGMRGVGWKEIETEVSIEGPIEEMLSDRALRIARARGAGRYALSATVSGDLAVATVLFSGDLAT